MNTPTNQYELFKVKLAIILGTLCLSPISDCFTFLVFQTCFKITQNCFYWMVCVDDLTMNLELIQNLER